LTNPHNEAKIEDNKNLWNVGKKKICKIALALILIVRERGHVVNA